MTPVFCCGFECGATGAGHLPSVDAGVTISTSVVRSGPRSLNINVTAASGAADFPALSSSFIWVYRFYIYFSTLPSADCAIFTTQNSNRPGVYFKNSDSKIYTGLSANFGTTGISVTTDRWYRIDVKVDATNNPWTIDAQVDGIACSQKTTAVAAQATTLVRIGGIESKTVNCFYDDVLLSNTSADYPLGNGYIHPFILTADGTHNIAGTGDFQRGNTGVDILNATTTAFQLIDDVPLPSGAVAEADCWRGVAPANPTTDYVEGLFGPASGIPTPGKAPRAVEVILAHHQISTTVGQMQVRLNDNGTLDTTFDTGAAAGVTTYRYARKHYAAGPAGAWTVVSGAGNFNNVRCRFLAQDANPDQCLDAIMIEAEFAEQPQKIVQIKQAVNRSNTY